MKSGKVSQSHLVLTAPNANFARSGMGFGASVSLTVSLEI